MRPEDSVSLVQAGNGERLLNFFIDQIAVVFIAAIILAIRAPADGSGSGDVMGSVAWYLTYVAYYVVCESTTQRTLGKLVTRTRVVTFDNRPPSFAQVLGRSFARIIPFEPFSFLARRGGWHDRWSETFVVRNSRVS